jgi:alkanesulfonate monooxygenase SsuD/methylene tetrahydromethanopterin reductase-like flavin-dependent oxidoreductase (luciferase family)
VTYGSEALQAAEVNMQFHLFLPQMRMSIATILERARTAESSGFSGIAFMDHLAPPRALEHDMWEAMAIAGWVLAGTETLQVGHLVLCDGFRHPAVLARQVTSLDHASGGRFELGIGWGSVADEFATFGFGAAPPRERVSRLAESLHIMRGLWSGEVVDHVGQHFTLSGARQRPIPTRRIPITIGGVGPRTLALVREHADWWNVPAHDTHRLDEVREQAGDARVSLLLMVGLVHSAEERATTTEVVERRWGGTNARRNIVIGTPAELTEHFAGLADKGVERCFVWFTDFAPPPTLHAFSEVMSRIPS